MKRLTIEEYEKMAPMELPYYAENSDVTLKTVKGRCARCRGFLTAIRGRIWEVGPCLEVKGAGTCPACRLLVPLRMRWHTDRDQVQYIEDGEWCFTGIRVSVRERLRHIFYRISDAVTQWWGQRRRR